MRLIGIGGAHSDSGKTMLACALLRALPGWGALKCTPEGLYATVSDDPATLGRPGSDTAMYIEAGAAGVVWVRAPRHELEESLELALGHLADLPGVVVEGNSAIEVLSPDIVIFILGEPGRMKETSLPVMQRADALVQWKQEPDAKDTEGSKGVRVFQADETEALTAFVKEALKEPEHDR